MSVALRGSIIILLCFIGISLLVFEDLKKSSLLKKCEVYVKYLAIVFPFIDLKMAPMGFRIDIFTTCTVTFLILNYRVISKVPHKLLMTLVGLLGIAIFCAICSNYVLNSIISSVEILVPFILLFAILVLLLNKKQKVVYHCFILIALYVILFGVIQQFLYRDFTVYYNSRIEDIRITSVFNEPQTAGCAIAILAMYFWNQFLYSKKTLQILLFLGLIFIGAFTGSKTFLIGLIIAIIVSMLFKKIDIVYIALMGFLATLFIVFSDYIYSLPVFERMQDFDNSYEGRNGYFWLIGYNLFKEHFLTGIGIGNFQLYNIDFLKIVHWSGTYATQPESGYLLWFDEMGIWGIYPLLMLVYLLLKRGYKAYNISIIIPWVISFISVYNLESNQLKYILFISFALILFSSGCFKCLHYENSNSRKNKNSSCQDGEFKTHC